MIKENELMEFFDKSNADIKKWRVIKNTDHFDEWESDEMYFGYIFI